MHEGASTTLASSPGIAVRAYEPWKDAKAGAEVMGNRVSCFVDGNRIISATIPDISPLGSIGVESWTRTPTTLPTRSSRSKCGRSESLRVLCS